MLLKSLNEQIRKKKENLSMEWDDSLTIGIAILYIKVNNKNSKQNDICLK